MDSLRKEFEDCALQYMDDIYRAALKMTRDEIEAEDLVQDTYLRAYTYFYRFEKGTCMKAWLLKILKNTFINKSRKQAKRPEHIELSQLNLSEEEPVSENDPEEDILYISFGDRLMRAIYNLPEEFRTVILLSALEGFSYREIAETIDCPVGTVMSRLHRGRKLLRNSLREYLSELGYILG